MASTLESPSRARSKRLATAPDAVTVEALRKTFRLPHRRANTFKERALHPFQSRTYDELHAVRDVTFNVASGEFFGIVGRNGSGKSTLLKCLAGIYVPDGGRLSVEGRLSPFIELGVGFNAELTARENVMINAVMLGLSRREARRRFDEVIAFAELEDFLDLKLKNYSSGMGVRLAFSVAVLVESDVLLVDEVLAVGDVAFQQKCFEQFHRLKAAGRTIVFVTHDMGTVERFCDRAMLLERGELMDIGEPATITRAYNEVNFGQLVHHEVEGARQGDHVACEIESAWFESGGERVGAVAQGDPLVLAFQVRFDTAVQEPEFAVALRNAVGHTVFATSTAWRDEATGGFDAGAGATVRVELETWLAPSEYKLTPSVARAGAGAGAIDLREDLATLLVHGARHTGGLIDPPHSITVERG